MIRSKPVPKVSIELTTPKWAQSHADFIRRNFRIDEIQVLMDRMSNCVSTKSGRFFIYNCILSNGVSGVAVMSENNEKWFMGDWQKDWEPQMKRYRRFSTYREFLDSTCKFKQL